MDYETMAPSVPVVSPDESDAYTDQVRAYAEEARAHARLMNAQAHELELKNAAAEELGS